MEHVGKKAKWSHCDRLRRDLCLVMPLPVSGLIAGLPSALPRAKGDTPAKPLLKAWAA
jgi:hypothetical protein